MIEQLEGDIKVLFDRVAQAQQYSDTKWPNRFVITLKEVTELSTLDFSEFANLVLNNICKYFEYNVETIKGKNRLSEYVDCRKMFTHYMIENYGGFSLENLGAVINRDHATIIYYRKEHQALYQTNRKYQQNYNQLVKYLYK